MRMSRACRRLPRSRREARMIARRADGLLAAGGIERTASRQRNPAQAQAESEDRSGGMSEREDSAHGGKIKLS